VVVALTLFLTIGGIAVKFQEVITNLYHVVGIPRPPPGQGWRHLSGTCLAPISLPLPASPAFFLPPLSRTSQSRLVATPLPQARGPAGQQARDPRPRQPTAATYRKLGSGLGVRPASTARPDWASRAGAVGGVPQSLCTEPITCAAGSARASLAGAARPRSQLSTRTGSRRDPGDGGDSVAVTGPHECERCTAWAVQTEGLPAASRPKRAPGRSGAGGSDTAAACRRAAWRGPTGCSDGQAKKVGHGLELHDGEVAASKARW
jgi:hypothetical protein